MEHDGQIEKVFDRVIVAGGGIVVGAYVIRQDRLAALPKEARDHILSSAKEHAEEFRDGGRKLDEEASNALAERLKLDWVDIDAFIATLEAEFQAETSGSHLVLDWKNHLAGRRMRTEGHRLRTIVQHLVQNAIKFTPPDGQVRVEFAPSADALVVTVSDSGIGISPDDVESIFDDLLNAVSRHGGYRLDARQIDALTKKAFSPPKEPGGHWILNRDLVGKDAAVLAKAIGLTVPANTQILFGETDTSNPFVPEEQMMPFVPFVRAKNSDHAIDMALEYEHGFRHTSIIHTRNVNTMTKMGKLMETTLFIKNGPCGAGLGLGGEGYLSFSIATPTGEGVTNPLTFTRQRRCTLVDDLRII